jgi:hypothetical protein
MLRRFAAATATASAVLAIASLVVRALPVPLERFTPLLALWCLAPAVWGLWAMLAPGNWVPGRLPQWGSLLGVLAGILAMLVLDLPARVRGLPVPLPYRVGGAALLAVFYYFLWMLVARAYRALAPGPA